MGTVIDLSSRRVHTGHTEEERLRGPRMICNSLLYSTLFWIFALVLWKCLA